MIHPKPAEISWKEICKSFPGKDEQVRAANNYDSSGTKCRYLIPLDYRAAGTGARSRWML
jgi:hypothetical protein